MKYLLFHYYYYYYYQYYYPSFLISHFLLVFVILVKMYNVVQHYQSLKLLSDYLIFVLQPMMYHFVVFQYLNLSSLFLAFLTLLLLLFLLFLLFLIHLHFHQYWKYQYQNWLIQCYYPKIDAIIVLMIYHLIYLPLVFLVLEKIVELDIFVNQLNQVMNHL